jgi:CheY-like chemotaxis protein
VTHVLIVDDDSDIRETLRELICSRGHRADTADNGLIALELLVQTSESEDMPEIILLDLTMPVMSGTELIKVLEKDARFSHIPIIIMSANLELLRYQKLISLAKPFSIDRLFGLLDSWPSRYSGVCLE